MTLIHYFITFNIPHYGKKNERRKSREYLCVFDNRIHFLLKAFVNYNYTLLCKFLRH